MSPRPVSRRIVLKNAFNTTLATAIVCRTGRAESFRQANDRPTIGAIGTGSRWCQKATGINGPWGSAPDVKKFGDYVAVCDADRSRTERAASLVKEWHGVSPSEHSDYREVLDNPKIDIVHISTPDHWHAKIAIEAMLAGKDVYCEKPMTLTIPEGRELCDVCRKTGRIVQIGTQQRSEKQFIQAIALLRNGRLGKVTKATCRIGGAPTSPEIPIAEPPKDLDWNLWQGPVREAPFRYLAGDNGETKSWSRCHYEFRWWYEYSGGKLTDWGAHHVDIATWGLGLTKTGPTEVIPELVKHPVEFKDGYPVDASRYNTATEFLIRANFAQGIEIEIRHDGDNGILFEGTEGRLFVNRGRISGKPVEDLQSNPLPATAMEEAYKNRPLVDHFRNFFESARDRVEPISDVHSHHRALTTCHLAGIAARLNRPVTWDADREVIVGDEQAQRLLHREPRKGFETLRS
ncbi:MAG: Gfo/Idh/MocA family oxidoreductase [Planctomycetes bacterium]|nr:Gfo/Idh/MocA family oxidoreductase [Planctomycetota bacterium]